MFKPIWERQRETRSDRLAAGSPPFEISISDLAASSTMNYGFEFRDGIKKYLPMNYIRILNKGGTDLKIYINDNTSSEVILDNTLYERNGPIWSFKLENISATVAATGAQIYTTVQRKPAGG